MKTWKTLLYSGITLCLLTNCEKGENKKEKQNEESPALVEQKESVVSETPKEETSVEGTEQKAKELKETKSEPSKVVKGRVAATFADGTVIEQSEVFDRIDMLPKKIRGHLSFEQLYNLVLFVVIQDHLAYHAAIKEGLDQTPEMKKTLEQRRKSLLHKLFLDEISSPLVTEEAIQKQYDELVKDFKSVPEWGLRHILVATEAESKRVLKELADGKPFDECWKQYTIDKKTTNEKGFLGYFKESQLPKENVKQILVTNPGNFVPTAVYVPKTGYSILMVTDVRDSKPTPVTDKKVNAGLRSIVAKRAQMDYLESLVQKAGCILFDPAGKKMKFESVAEKIQKARESSSNKKAKPTAEEIKLEDQMNSMKTEAVVLKFASGETVTFDQILNFIQEHRDMFKNLSLLEMYKRAAEEYAQRKVLDDAVQQADFEKNPAFVQKWEALLRSELSKEYLKKAANRLLPDSELRRHYDALMEKLAREFETSLSVIPTKSAEDAEKALAELRTGKKFDEVFNKYCSNDAFKEKKGNLGYLSNDKVKMLSTELSEAVMKAPKATVIQKVFFVNGMYLVVRVVDRRQLTIPSFKETKEYIKDNLNSEKQVDVTLNLIEKYGVKAFDFAGKQLDLSQKELARSLGGVTN